MLSMTDGACAHDESRTRIIEAVVSSNLNGEKIDRSDAKGKRAHCVSLDACICACVCARPCSSLCLFLSLFLATRCSIDLSSTNGHNNVNVYETNERKNDEQRSTGQTVIPSFSHSLCLFFALCLAVSLNYMSDRRALRILN